MGKYIKCPRCELNYILEEDKYCDVCKAELKLGPTLLFTTDEEETGQILCPICKRNYIFAGEEMCDECREDTLDKSKIEPDVDVDLDKDDDTWRKYLDEDEKEAISNKVEGDELISLSELEEEEAEQFFDDEEEIDDDDYYDDEPDDEDDFNYDVDESDYEEDEDESDEEEDDLF